MSNILDSILGTNPNGTAFGNALRSVAKDYSSGFLGSGSMKRKENETSEQHQNRVATALGSALSSFNSQINNKPLSDDLTTNIKIGVVMDYIRKYAPVIIAVPIVYFITKKIKK